MSSPTDVFANPSMEMNSEIPVDRKEPVDNADDHVEIAEDELLDQWAPDTQNEPQAFDNTGSGVFGSDQPENATDVFGTDANLPVESSENLDAFASEIP